MRTSAINEADDDPIPEQNDVLKTKPIVEFPHKRMGEVPADTVCENCKVPDTLTRSETNPTLGAAAYRLNAMVFCWDLALQTSLVPGHVLNLTSPLMVMDSTTPSKLIWFWASLTKTGGGNSVVCCSTSHLGVVVLHVMSGCAGMVMYSVTVYDEVGGLDGIGNHCAAAGVSVGVPPRLAAATATATTTTAATEATLSLSRLNLISLGRVGALAGALCSPLAIAPQPRPQAANTSS